MAVPLLDAGVGVRDGYQAVQVNDVHICSPRRAPQFRFTNGFFIFQMYELSRCRSHSRLHHVTTATSVTKKPASPKAMDLKVARK